jgi:hypothetical protein
MHFRPTARFRVGILFLSYYDRGRHFCPDHLGLLQANSGVYQYLDSLN